MPFVIAPLVKVALGMLGAGFVAHWVSKEMRRINEEIERVRDGSATFDPAVRRTLPTLRRDPRTGEWRVM